MSEHKHLREEATRQHSHRIHEIRRAHGGGISGARDDRVMVIKGVHQHEKADHPGKPLTKLKLADGGVAEGHAGRKRMDRAGRRKRDDGGSAGVNQAMNPSNNAAQQAMQSAIDAGLANSINNPNQPKATGQKRGGRAKRQAGGGMPMGVGAMGMGGGMGGGQMQRPGLPGPGMAGPGMGMGMRPGMGAPGGNMPRPAPTAAQMPQPSMMGPGQTAPTVSAPGGPTPGAIGTPRFVGQKRGGRAKEEDREHRRAHGGRSGKGKAGHVNVIVATGGADRPPMPAGPIPAAGGMPPPRPPMPPPGLGMGMPGGMPTAGMPMAPGAGMGMARPPMAPGMPGMPMRAKGGRVPKAAAGALSAEGRLARAKMKIESENAAGDY